jgi:hypothetical protein
MTGMETLHIDSIDPRLDWNPRHDPASLQFPIRAALGTVEDKPRAWDLGEVLDQGQEGACVGFGWTADLLASPRPDKYATAAVGNRFARNVYFDAQRIDEWEGENYEGTSVLAGAKVIAAKGYMSEYRWAFSIEDVRDAVIAEGPVVIGIPWYSNMYGTRPSGLLDIGGQLVGGHCILVSGYHPSMRIRGEGWNERHRVFRLRNSWGPDWGVNGNGFIKYDDLAALLREWGEACVPVGRKMVRL